MGLGDELTLVDLEADPDPILARMRVEEPVCWVPALDMWLVTRWDDVAWIEAHPELFTAATEPSFLARALGPNLLTIDPPAHTKLKEILLPPFQSGGRSGTFVADELAPMADDLLTGLGDGGDPVDLMAGYAQPLAAAALATVLGLDHHGFDRMWAWCAGLVGDIANFANDPALTAAGEKAKSELGAAITDQLAEGSDDGSAIAWFAHHGASRDEVVNNVRLMISGGINEPRDGIGLVTWVWLTRPDLRAEVAAEPGRMRRLVEEVFRLYSPVGTITRQATAAVELGGRQIEAGQLVSGVLRSVNRDADHWTGPDEIDLGRREGPHAAFALGEHRCLGEWLGRQVVRVGCERLLAQFPELQLAPGHEVRLSGFEFRGPEELWVRTV